MIILRFLAAAFLCLKFSWAPFAFVTVDGSSSTNATATSSVTFSHTTGTGYDRLLLVGVSLESSGNRQVSSITYNAQALTRTGFIVDGAGKVRSEIWRLINPPSGTANVVVNLSANSPGFVVGATTFTGVHQTTPLGTFTSAEGKSKTPSVALSSATNEIVFDTVTYKGGDNLNAGANQVVNWTASDAADEVRGASSIENGAATVTMSWASTGNGVKDWAIGAVAIKPAPWADIRTTVSGPASAPVASATLYTIAVTNLGPNVSSNLVVSDPLPTGSTFVSASGGGTHNNGVVTWNLSSLAVNGTATLTVSLTAPTIAGPITNTVTSSSATTDTNLSNNNGSAPSGRVVTTLSPGPFQKMQLLVPGETSAPGTVSGRAGTVQTQTVAVSFNITANAVDAYWNLVSSSDTIAIASSDSSATLPANGALSSGTRTVSLTLGTPGSPTATASDVTNPLITAHTSSAIPVMGNQTINFPVIPGQVQTNIVNLSATASSGLTVTFAVSSGPASIANGTNLTFSAGGSVTVTASQTGNALWHPAPNVSRTFDVNALPVPSSPTILRWPLAGSKLRLTNLLGTDADGDTLSIQSVGSSSAQGGSVTTNSNWVFFAPAAGFTNSDSFSYAVADNRGAAAGGTVTVNILADTRPTENYTTEDLGGGSLRIHFSGVPGRSYRFDFTDTLVPPSWVTFTNAVVGASGLFTCTDTPPGGPGSRWYRTVHIAP